MPQPTAMSDRLWKEIAIVRETMLKVHYFEESHWLAAAVSFPRLCESPTGQRALRSAATIAWQFGFPAVTHWLNTEILRPVSGDESEKSSPPRGCRETEPGTA